jgi:hypothetical protein
MGKHIQIQTEKRYMGKAWIARYMRLLNVIAPGKYRLDTTNMFASIEDIETQMTVAVFTDNPFKI